MCVCVHTIIHIIEYSLRSFYILSKSSGVCGVISSLSELKLVKEYSTAEAKLSKPFRAGRDSSAQPHHV